MNQKTLHQTIPLAPRTKLQRLGSLLRQLFPRHEWKRTDDGINVTQTCTICGQHEVYERDDWVYVAVEFKRGDLSKH